ncbi:Protein FAR1-RELATED SEQUENCE 5, partial [Glycine soja]
MHLKYFVCSKEGYRPNKTKVVEQSVSTIKSRRSLTREGCNVNVVFKLVEEGKYELIRFHETHTHTHALASPMKRQFLRSARKVNLVHENLMLAYNRANICASFTGINHHRQCVTFGAGFLAYEKIDSFIWLFEKFCMRHIMKKNSEKVGVSLNVNKKFYNHFKSCVWGLETQNDFESTWKAIMVRFKLEKNDWLSHMYDIQSMLIPAYFRDMFLAGILRTTSRSKKKHRRDIYTHENLYIFQKKSWIACVDCGVENNQEQDGMEILHVIDNNEANGRLREVVWKGLTEIPSNYTMNRWTKLANRKPVFDITVNVLNTFSKPKNESYFYNIWGHFFRCMDKAEQHKEKLLLVMNGVVNIEKQLAEYERDSKQTKTDDLETFVGSSIPKEVGILPPQFSKTKGSGK